MYALHVQHMSTSKLTWPRSAISWKTACRVLFDPRIFFGTRSRFSGIHRTSESHSLPEIKKKPGAFGSGHSLMRRGEAGCALVTRTCICVRLISKPVDFLTTAVVEEFPVVWRQHALTLLYQTQRGSGESLDSPFPRPCRRHEFVIRMLERFHTHS